MSTELHLHDGTAWREAKQLYIRESTSYWSPPVKKAYIHDGTSWKLAFSGADIMTQKLGNAYGFDIIAVNNDSILYYVEAPSVTNFYLLNDSSNTPTLIETLSGFVIQRTLSEDLILFYSPNRVLLFNTRNLTLVENVTSPSPLGSRVYPAYVNNTLTYSIGISTGSSREIFLGNGLGIVTYPATCLRDSNNASIATITSPQIFAYCNGMLYFRNTSGFNYWFNTSSGVCRQSDTGVAGQLVLFTVNNNVYSQRLGLLNGSSYSGDVLASSIGVDLSSYITAYPKYIRYTLNSSGAQLGVLNLSTMLPVTFTDPVSGLDIATNASSLIIDGTGNLYFISIYTGIPALTMYIYKVNTSGVVSRFQQLNSNTVDNLQLLNTVRGSNIQYYFRSYYSDPIYTKYKDTNTGILKIATVTYNYAVFARTQLYTYEFSNDEVWRLYNVDYI